MDNVFDLDAVATESEESGREPFRFKFGGEEYILPPDIDLRWAPIAAKEGIDAWLFAALGDEQFQRMNKSNAVFDNKRLAALMAEYEKHRGIKLGESSASTGSSKSTVRPSKRTSGATTKSRSRISSTAD